MKEYIIKITETLEKVVIIKAFSEQDAKSKVRTAWKNGDYILDAEDFQGVAFTVCEANK